jgi:hypothetical protein
MSFHDKNFGRAFIVKAFDELFIKSSSKAYQNPTKSHQKLIIAFGSNLEQFKTV